MSNLPSGTVTFLFTDIEDSTKLWQAHPEAMASAQARHDAILRESIETNNGYIFQTVGDSFSAAFDNARDAIRAAISAQRILSTEAWTQGTEIKVRMGMHTGSAVVSTQGKYDEGYVTVATAQRVMSAAHGGQVLVSHTTYDLLQNDLEENITLRDMGEHRLKGLHALARLYQLAAPDLRQNFPPLASLSSFPNNLPVQLTSFIGRERELDQAQKKFETARLLTLIGPGGTGKTRLSVQIGMDQLPNFKDGVWLVELAPLSDPAFIIPAIASVFELREVQNIPLLQLVVDYLRAKDLLLIIDNCEHLVETSAQVADQLLHAGPTLKIIVSSREALGIEGETVYRVPSLKEQEATRLFVERAMVAEPRFKLTEQNASPVAQICSRLDGIPLAIELAAARVKIFTPEQIAERLDDRFKLLTGGVRTALPRQQTLRALIDWSYQLLNETEQIALRRLAVFSGGWTIEAAESVLGESEALDGLLALVNKSLVLVEEQAGKSRYRFLETIRQYAMEKLVESGEASAVRDRHLEYMLTLTDYSPERMFGTEAPETMDRIEMEHDNLRSALAWALGNNLSKALKLAYSAGGFWAVRDYNSEARAWCNAILEKSADLPDADGDRGRLYSFYGWISATMGEHKAGRHAAEQAIELGTRSDDPATLVRSYATLALTCIFLGEYPAAFEAAEKGEKIARQHGFMAELAFVLSTRAQMEYFARTSLEQAKAYLYEASDLAKKSGFGWASSFMAIGLGHTAAIVGDLEQARAAFLESAEIAKKIGNKRILYSSQSEFAHILRERGGLEEPLAIYRDLLPKWKDLGHRSAVAHELECVAYILVKKEEPARAATLLGAAQVLRENIDSVMTKSEQVEYAGEVAALRRGMEEVEFETNWKKGRSLTMDEAIQHALE